ncbi:hypothetical protein FB446DRAFT_745801 [Lentinula raphanica]|nr:hypothetical protein FB446DRAFT_745801 [Lentinula raphanica]
MTRLTLRATVLILGAISLGVLAAPMPHPTGVQASHRCSNLQTGGPPPPGHALRARGFSASKASGDIEISPVPIEKLERINTIIRELGYDNIANSDESTATKLLSLPYPDCYQSSYAVQQMKENYAELRGIVKSLYEAGEDTPKNPYYEAKRTIDATFNAIKFWK